MIYFEKIILPSLVLIIPNSHRCALPYCIFTLVAKWREYARKSQLPSTFSLWLLSYLWFSLFYCFYSCLYFINWQYTGNIRLGEYTPLKKKKKKKYEHTYEYIVYIWIYKNT
jgi:hypothetical protein